MQVRIQEGSRGREAEGEKRRGEKRGSGWERQGSKREGRDGGGEGWGKGCEFGFFPLMPTPYSQLPPNFPPYSAV